VVREGRRGSGTVGHGGLNVKECGRADPSCFDMLTNGESRLEKIPWLAKSMHGKGLPY
jgi:hypothetical protein